MTTNALLLPIVIPFVIGVLTLFITKIKGLKEALAILATLVNLVIAIMFFNQEFVFCARWCGFGINLMLRLYHFSAFIMLAAAGFGFLVTLYSAAFMKDKKYLNQYYAYVLITIAFLNGAVLADNLVAMLFFWEGLLITTFGFIVIGGGLAIKTAIKAFVITGIADVCFMFGIGLTAYLAGTLIISEVHLPITTLGGIAFVFLMTGAIAKAGSMPFHSWIPDAAIDAPLPFMALLPAALEKLLGIYFLARITLDLFQFNPHSWASPLLMIIGCCTILFAVMMALIQKDYKRLLSYHAISQVGYMVLGIGTAVPVGIVGGIFHMINHAMYKSCLFLTGGSVEKQTGTTNLEKLGGLARKMPVTFICFIIAAASISGVPPFNGFFSKELVYDGALERGWYYYAAALLGSFLTAASFLKLGHAAYAGKLTKEGEKAKESPLAMTIPMIIIAAVCVLFGVYNALPLRNLIQPILGEQLLKGHDFSGWPHSILLVAATVVALILAYLNHVYGVKKSGSAVGASDHIHYAPGLSGIYDKAEKRYFDPYDIGLKVMDFVSKLAWYIDRGIDWFYESFIVNVTYALTFFVRTFQNGNYSLYLLMSLTGAVAILIVFFKMIYGV